MTWRKGRELASCAGFEYRYNQDGIRIEKRDNYTIYQYVLDGTNILKEIVTDNCCNCTGYVNEYLYDLDGTVCGLKYNGTAYYFYKNLQGDVIAITNETGAVVARYSYDAWGKCTVESDASGVDIANINPFRYRSYYYDFEIGMYYLQSRYYDPEVGRFINADNATLVTMSMLPNGYGLFTYCCNNPIYNIDLAGFLAFSMAVIVSAAVVGAVFSAISQIALNFLSGRRGSSIFKGVAGAAVGGAVNIALLLVLWYVPGSKIIAGFVAGFIQAVIDTLFDVLVYKTLTWNQFFRKCTVDGLWNAAANITGNYLGDKLIFINRGWFKPKYVISFLTGSYGKKLITQTGIGTILGWVMNFIREKFRK